MSFFTRLFHGKEVKGEIGYFGLTEWWLSSFNEGQRNYFEQAYKYFGIGVGDTDHPLTRGDIASFSQSSIHTLSGMIGTLKDKPEYLHLAKSILQEAEKRKDGNVIDLHYLYHTTIEVAYSQRNKHPDALVLAIEACQKQISIAKQSAKLFKEEMSAAEAQRSFGACLPAHVGYTQLCIIYEKEKRFGDAIQLARQANAEGWAGDWEKRIIRCEKRLHN